MADSSGKITCRYVRNVRSREVIAGPIRKRPLPRFHRTVYLATLVLACIFDVSGCTSPPSARQPTSHLTAGDWVDNGLALVNDRDELFIRLRYTF